MTEPLIHPPMPEWLEPIVRHIYNVPGPVLKRLRFTLTPEEWLEYKQWQRDMGYVTATRAIRNCPIDIVSGEPEILWELF